MGSHRIEAAGSGTERLSKTGLIVLCLAALFPVAFQLFSGLHHLKLSWDDAAITTAFSRTWAHTGRVALTPLSQSVEGYSSILWFLLLSIPYFFTHNTDAGLVWMKIVSAIFLVLSLPVIYWIALRQFASRSAAIVSVLLLTYCFTSHQEIENGMEMNLTVFLLLVLFHLLTREQTKHRVLYASLTTCLLLLTRFEMPFMLTLLFVGFVYAALHDRAGAVPMRELLAIFAISVLFFGVTEIWRHHVFGEWMPNTIYAKRFIPYRDWSTPRKFVKTRLLALNEPIRVLRFPMLIAIVACIWAFRRKHVTWASFGKVHPAIWLLAAGCFLFGAIFGLNWGHPGRMVAGMIPFLILATVGVCVSVVMDKRQLTMVFAAVLVLHGFVWLRHAIYPYRIISMAAIEPLGPGVDAIRAALGQDKISVMMSDVGASSLCCERLEIIDSGLLADPTLARTGWPGFATYFQQRRPDVVETHSFWAQDSHFYSGLLDGYSIVASNGIRFFVRDDLYRKLVETGAGPIVPVASAPACMPIVAEDDAFSLTKGTCLVLNHPGVDNNLP
jgi:hypothetical protein